MMEEKLEEVKTQNFERKIYTRMVHDSISHLIHDRESPKKKIIPSQKISGIREEFKKIFLPLLIDIFELRQMIQNIKNNKKKGSFFSSKENLKSPREILDHLFILQGDVEEAERWCQGVIAQIGKGIEEVKEALQFIENCPEIGVDSPIEKKEKPKGFWKWLFKNVSRAPK